MKRISEWLRLKIGPHSAASNPLDALPDFQNFPYAIAIKPTGSHIDAWAKLCELERRLAMYKWVEHHNDPAKAQHRILLNDSVSAFLLTFEATIQFLKDQFKRSGTALQFDNWLAQRPENNIGVKGLRTLRHFEAHVEPKPIPRTVDFHIHSSLGGKEQEDKVMACIWRLPQLTVTDLDKLRTSPLADTELADWNSLVEKRDAKTVFADNILNLRSILETAETIL